MFRHFQLAIVRVSNLDIFARRTSGMRLWGISDISKNLECELKE